VTIHERIEGNVQVRAVPEVTIGDKPLAECSTPLIRRELLALMNLLAEKRKEIARLEANLNTREEVCKSYHTFLLEMYKGTPHDTIKSEIASLLGLRGDE
jgi:hypothetical protein